MTGSSNQATVHRASDCLPSSEACISIKLYMKNKPKNWGYKLFVLADSSTGYYLFFFVYKGKSVSTTVQSLSCFLVKKLLLLPVLDGGLHTVYGHILHQPCSL